jgi:hypothetical protein
MEWLGFEKIAKSRIYNTALWVCTQLNLTTMITFKTKKIHHSIGIDYEMMPVCLKKIIYLFLIILFQKFDFERKKSAVFSRVVNVFAS